ncbi:hypothetical protein SAMN05421850_1185 [Lutimaribacter saemankumensis]|uniref:Uncharacterized protein n=1 Tax=Lutimaribacter saemankumensis TaxID=490829 RepID=A0A1G8T8A2_9RHOB|nr:hypothetical protein SAMN05421850_1185 [Lutimaribacter saemankumensis]
MTHASSAPVSSQLSPSLPNSLVGLARLLAREAARSEFATRCNTDEEGQAHA